MNRDITCCCDYLQGSFFFEQGTIQSPSHLFDILSRIDSLFEETNFVRSDFGQFYGKYNFKYSYMGKQFFFFCFHLSNNEENPDSLQTPRIYFRLSGDGLRLLQEHDCLYSFLKFISKFDTSITRLDCAIDFFEKENSVVPTLQRAFKTHLESVLPFRKVKAKDKDAKLELTKNDYILQSRMKLDTMKEYIEPDLCREWNNVSYNYTCFSKESTLGSFKLYDKWLEIKTVPRFKDIADELLSHCPSDYWYRLEYEIVDEKANAMFRLWVENFDFTSVANWALSNFFIVREFQSSGYRNNEQRPNAVFFNLIQLFCKVDEDTLNSYLTKQKYVSDITVAAQRVKRCCTSILRDHLIAFLVPGLFEDMVVEQKLLEDSDEINKFKELRHDLSELLDGLELTEENFINRCHEIYPVIEHITGAIPSPTVKISSSESGSVEDVMLKCSICGQTLPKESFVKYSLTNLDKNICRNCRS